MSRSRYAGEGENYSRELQDVGDLLSKCWWAEQNNSIISSKKINEGEKKDGNFVVCPKGVHDGQK